MQTQIVTPAESTYWSYSDLVCTRFRVRSADEIYDGLEMHNRWGCWYGGIFEHLSTVEMAAELNAMRAISIQVIQ